MRSLKLPAGSANSLAPRGLACCLSSPWTDRHIAVNASISSAERTDLPRSVAKVEQDVDVVVVAEQARQLFGLPGAPAQHIRPGTRDELHVSPVLLHRLAPLVERLVGAVLVGFAEGATGPAVGALDACGEVLEADLPPLDARKELPGCFEAFERLAPLLCAGAGAPGAGAVCHQLGELYAHALAATCRTAYRSWPASAAARTGRARPPAACRCRQGDWLRAERWSRPAPAG